MTKNDESDSKIIENKSGKWKISTIFLYLLLYYFDAFEFTFTAYNKRKGLNVEKRGGGIIKMHAIYSKFYFVLN